MRRNLNKNAKYKYFIGEAFADLRIPNNHVFGDSSFRSCVAREFILTSMCRCVWLRKIGIDA